MPASRLKSPISRLQSPISRLQSAVYGLQPSLVSYVSLRCCAVYAYLRLEG